MKPLPRSIRGTSFLFLLFVASMPLAHAAPVEEDQALPGSGSPSSAMATGDPLPAMEAFEERLLQRMEQFHVPGGSVCVVKDGRLVYARGFGYADVASESVAQPDTLYRIASITKPITWLAIQRLIRDRNITANTRVFDYLGLEPPPGGIVDPRVWDITVQHLLEHRGGWNRDVRGDQAFASVDAARFLGIAAPAGPVDLVRYALSKPLDFTPGAEEHYSNLGYIVLARVVERASGLGYEEYVTQTLLQPNGITRTRLGRTRSRERFPWESRYYDDPRGGLSTSVFPGDPPSPTQYGGFYLEAIDGAGGWISSPIDVARLASRDLKGWVFYGGLPGTATLMWSTWDGLTWTAFFNSRPFDGAPNTERFFDLVNDDLRETVESVVSWPATDLFDRYYPGHYGVSAPPTVHLASPNGGERIRAGSTLEVTWSASDDQGVVKQGVYLSTDGGSTYAYTLAAEVDGNERRALIRLPVDVRKTKKARIRIVCLDADGSVTADESDFDFRISKRR